MVVAHVMAAVDAARATPMTRVCLGPVRRAASRCKQHVDGLVVAGGSPATGTRLREPLSGAKAARQDFQSLSLLFATRSTRPPTMSIAAIVSVVKGGGLPGRAHRDSPGAARGTDLDSRRLTAALFQGRASRDVSGFTLLSSRG